MKINKFILAAGVIGVVVGVLRLALVFVNTIPSPQQFPKWVWLVLTSLSIIVYQHNAWFAQRTGGALKRYVEAAQPVAAKRVLMTQSLGNMVACEALREGLQVGQYYMFDAAIPSEARTISIDRLSRL